MNGNDPAFEQLAERREEQAFKRGYEQGRLDQKTAAPTPKARALQTRVKTLEAETIPALCAELDELRAQRQFLFAAFRRACEEYGSTQGMKDYAGDVADGAFKILGVDIDATKVTQ
jgi:hypothetical protein